MSKYQIFLDLDCVLVDLLKGVENAIKNDHPCSDDLLSIKKLAQEELGSCSLKSSHLIKGSAEYKPAVKSFFKHIMRKNPDFWSGLPWMEEGRELWNKIRCYNPIILSKPTDYDSVIGKKAWVKQNLNISHDRVLIRDDKSEYAFFDGKIGLLIDDYDKNVRAFRDSGGEAILYNELSDALRDLKKYGF